MPELIMAGSPVTLTQNVAYNLPVRLVWITSSAALEGSIDGTTWTAITGAETSGANAGYAYVRCPSANANVICSRY